MRAEPKAAHLLFDSASGRPEWSSPEDHGGERTLLFQTRGVGVDLVLRQTAGGVRTLTGEARSPTTRRPLAGLLVRSEETGETAETDAEGRFLLGWDSDREGLRLIVETGRREIALDVPPRATE